MPELKVKSSLDSRNFNRNVDGMKGKVDKFSGGLMAARAKLKAFMLTPLGMVITAVIGLGAALVKVGKNAVNFGSKLSDMAAQTGVSVEMFQLLARAVRDAGGEEQHLVNALTRVKDAQGEVITGDKIMTEALDRLGISTEEFVGLNTEEAFMRIAKALTESGNAANEFSAVADIIGMRNVPKLLEAMNALAEGTDEMGEGLKIVTDEATQMLDLQADRWERWKHNIKSATAEATAAVLRFFWIGEEAALDERRRKAEAMEELEKRNRKEALQAMRRKKDLEEQQKLEKKLADILAKKKEVAEAPTQIRIISDVVARMGGKMGTQAGQLRSIAERQFNVQQQMLAIEQQAQTVRQQIAQNTANQGGLAP
jgi:hypothetical protein